MYSSKIIETPNFDRINPSTCVNARLRRLHRMINSAYQQKINPFGLRGSMLSILFIIGKKQGVNQKSIADLLVLDPSTMSRDLKKLEKKGWIQASKGMDARITEWKLTKEGYLLLEEVSPVWEELHRKVTSILGEFQLQQIDVLTEAIRTNLVSLKA